MSMSRSIRSQHRHQVAALQHGRGRHEPGAEYPAGSAHGFLNRYEEPARLLFVYPTHQVEQVEVSIPGATLGFPSEKGLSGYRSPEDRPLGEGR